MTNQLGQNQMKIEPMIRFDPSQRRFFTDPARVIVVIWHRQKGKDFTAAAKAIDSAMETGQDWFIVSLTQRQADATFDKCKRIAKSFEAMLKTIVNAGESEFGTEQFDKATGKWFQYTARIITLPNGARIISLPGRDPDTLAGLTGNVIFTEFGLFPNGGYDHWRVVFPLTTRGYRCIIITTPRGKNTKAYELFKNEDGDYSVHFCDIYKSVAEDGFVLSDNNGNPTTIENFKRLYKDAAGWVREYECQFSGDLSSLIKWAQLEQAAALSAGQDFSYLHIEKENGWDAGFFSRELPGGARLEVGWDVARRGNLSVVAVNLAAPKQPRHLRFLVTMQDCSFDFMRNKVVRGAMDSTRLSVGRGDSTGMGFETNEVLERVYRDRWEGVNFAGGRKKEIASSLATAFSDGDQTIPPMESGEPYAFVATDLYAIQKDDTGGSLVLEETPNPLLEASHCDIGWAIGLARMAALQTAVGRGVITRSGRKPAGC